MEYQFNDGLQPAGRTPKLWFVHNGQVHKFDGQSIPGIVAVIKTVYVKNGKWSNTTFDLELASGVVPCYLLAPMHGQVWPENSRRIAYERFLREFGVVISFDEFDAALERNYPRSRARMLEGEKALESLEETGDSELVSITVGKLCRRNPHSDVRITAPDGRSWVVAHEAKKGLTVPGVFELVSTHWKPGYKGGQTTLSFAIFEGVIVEIQSYPKDGEADSTALGRDAKSL